MTPAEAKSWLELSYPDVPWETASMGGVTCIGLPCPDGIMLYMRLGDIEQAAKQTLTMTGTKHVGAKTTDPTIGERDSSGC
jgi:hypothetical protein